MWIVAAYYESKGFELMHAERTCPPTSNARDLCQNATGILSIFRVFLKTQSCCSSNITLYWVSFLFTSSLRYILCTKMKAKRTSGGVGNQSCIKQQRIIQKTQFSTRTWELSCLRWWVHMPWLITFLALNVDVLTLDQLQFYVISVPVLFRKRLQLGYHYSC